MDNLTHTLCGLMMSRAGLNRWCPRATPLLLLSANVPDIDIVTALGGSVPYLEHHRGPTHGFPMLPVMALVPLLAVWLFRRKGWSWRRGYVVSALGVASHLLMDWTNIYGIRLLSPFSERWFRLDITGVIDAWIWAVFFLAVAAPLLARLVNIEIGAKPGSGRGFAVFALIFVLALECGRAVLHARAVAVLESRLHAGEAPKRVAAFPSLANPFRWTGVAESGGAYVVHRINLFREFDPAAGRVFYKADAPSPIEAASATEPFRVFLGFSQFPLWRVVPAPEPEGGLRVEATDLRFGFPGEGAFTATAILGPDLRVLRADYQFGGPSRVPPAR